MVGRPLVASRPSARARCIRLYVAYLSALDFFPFSNLNLSPRSLLPSLSLPPPAALDPLRAGRAAAAAAADRTALVAAARPRAAAGDQRRVIHAQFACKRACHLAVLTARGPQRALRASLLVPADRITALLTQLALTASYTPCNRLARVPYATQRRCRASHVLERTGSSLSLQSTASHGIIVSYSFIAHLSSRQPSLHFSIPPRNTVAQVRRDRKRFLERMASQVRDGAVEVARVHHTAPNVALGAAFPAPGRRRAYSAVDQVPNEILADTVALILEQFCAGGSSDASRAMPDPTEPAALFFSPARQTAFTLSFYCRRLVEYTCCSKSAFVVAILYLARLAESHPVFLANEFNVHRLVCTAVVLAAKWLDDVSYSNAYYAIVAGVQSTNEMTRMENHMLRCLDFRLYVTQDNYFDVEASLLKIASSFL